MKTKHTLTLSFIILHSSFCLSARAQGPLTPSGPPGPTFKTLSQIEPRIPITNVPYTITAPGSYYLITNFLVTSASHGITITSSGEDVTLDLNGFELRGDIGTGDGIRVSGTTKLNLRISNGTVRGWGGTGVNAALAVNSQLTDLRVSHCGVNGLQVGDRSIISGCTVTICTSNGIVAGASSLIKDSTAVSSGNGIVGGDGGSIIHCVARSNTDVGIVASNGSAVSGCTASLNGGDGIRVSENCAVVGNVCTGNGVGSIGAAGIRAVLSGNRIDSNNVTGNDHGIEVDAGDNLIIRNSARANATEYVIFAGNTVGPTVTSATIGANSNPHANYDF